jgi:hypothetical protein
MRGVAVCGQPALIANRGLARAAASGTARGGAALEAAVPELPAWLASAHRFVEQKEFEIEKIKRHTARPTSRQAESVEGMSLGVDEIRQTLDRLVKKGML